jgi:hypothetical protein
MDTPVAFWTTEPASSSPPPWAARGRGRGDSTTGFFDEVATVTTALFVVVPTCSSPTA